MIVRAHFGILLGMLTCAAAPFTVYALAPGDPSQGAKIYERCIACHAIERDRTGPRHARLFGRRAGGVPGFPYSQAMQQAGAAGLVWTEENIDKFLENPMKFLPGTRMGYAGVKDDQERADLIAYLKQATRPQ
jgi:cytochrome c